MVYFKEYYNFQRFQRGSYIFQGALWLLSYDVASGSEITLCNKIDKPLVVYRLPGNVMTFITTLRNILLF